MIDDFKPIVYKTEEDLEIYPLFDLHVGSAQFNKKRFLDWIDKIKKDDKARIIIGGDLMDNGLKSSVTNVYEQTMRPCEQKDWIADMLRPVADKILCGTGGNHERRSSKDSDDNPLYDVFCRLGIEDRFRENACFLICVCGGPDRRNISGKYRPVYSFMVTHGAGGGSTIGCGANRNEKFGLALDGVDVLVTGHTHKPVTFPDAKLFVDVKNKKVSVKKFICVTASSWLNYGGYPIQKMLMPAAQIEQKILLCAHEKHIQVVQG